MRLVCPRLASKPMRRIRRLLAALAALAAGLTCAAQASAAALATEAPCYQAGADVVTIGGGFIPISFVRVLLDARDIGLAATDAQGVFRNKFSAPSPAPGKPDEIHGLVATDGTNVAIGSFRSTEVSAGFSPKSGNLGSLRVRFNARGFGIYERHPSVYVHYVRPDGKQRRTIRLGTARGTCGQLGRTRKRLLFPFTAQRGTWTLQFDTRKHYGKAKATSRFAWVRRTVRVGG